MTSNDSPPPQGQGVPPGHPVPASRLSQLQTVAAALGGPLTPAQAAAVAVEQGVAALGAAAGSLVLRAEDDDEALEVVGSVGYAPEDVAPWRRFPVAAAVPLAEAVRTGAPLWLEGPEAWARYPGITVADASSREGHDAWAAVPVAFRGRPAGALGLSFARARPLSDEDRAFTLTLALLYGEALERARLRQDAETARRDSQFLAGASRVLASSLDYGTTLAAVARLAVPDLADWCAVDLAGEAGSVERLAVAHVDPAKVQWAHEVHRRYPPNPDGPTGVPHVLRTGASEFYPHIPDELLAASIADPDQLRLMRDLGLRSVMMVPLAARGRTLGALTFVTTAESGRRYGPADLALAEDLGRRAALAVDNARLYRDAILSERGKNESLAQLEAFLASAPAGFAFLDGEGRYVRVNETLARLNGLSVEAHLGRTMEEALGPEAWAARRGFFERALAGEATQDADVSDAPPRTGSPERHLHVSYYPVRIAGAVVGVGTVVSDMTERWNAEEYLRRTEARQRALLRDVLANVTEGALRLCHTAAELPPECQAAGGPVPLSRTAGLAELRHRVQEAARAAGMAEERRQDIVTAASEAAMNAAVHAGGGTGRVSLGAEGMIQVRVEDRGGGIAVEDLPRAALAKGFTTAGTLGHGMKMMLETADRIWLLTGPGGTTVVLEQDRERPLPPWLAEDAG